MRVPREGSFFQDCRFCTCSLISLEWALPPWLYVSVLTLRAAVSRYAACSPGKSDQPRGATRGTNICLALLVSCTSWYGPALAQKKECLFQNFTEIPKDISSSRGPLPIPQSSFAYFPLGAVSSFTAGGILLEDVSSIKAESELHQGFKKFY